MNFVALFLANRENGVKSLNLTNFSIKAPGCLVTWLLIIIIISSIIKIIIFIMCHQNISLAGVLCYATKSSEEKLLFVALSNVLRKYTHYILNV